MLRITELKLPLDHPESAIKTAIVNRLGIGAEELITYTVFRQGHDARKRDAISLVYTLDVETNNEQAVLTRLKNDPAYLLNAGYHLPLCNPGSGHYDRAACGHRHRALRVICRVDSGADGFSPDNPGTG